MRNAEKRHVDLVVAIPLSLAVGIALWIGDRAAQSAMQALMEGWPRWLVLATNAGIEEALRLIVALATMAAIHRLDLEPSMATMAAIASCCLAALENASYVAAFPTLDAYWRLGYALPIHIGAATLYALSTAAPRRERPRMPRWALVVASLLAAWAWHTAFNGAATYAPFALVAPIGTIVNMIMLAALVGVAAIRFGYWSIYATGRF